MNDLRCAFITGGTGLLGVNIVRELIQNTSAKIVLLVRNPTPEKRAKFFHDLFSFGGGLWPIGFSYDRIRFVNGDVVQPHLGVSPGQRTRLYREIDMVYHSAAVIKLSGAEAETQAVNVQGTKNVLDFAWKCKEKGRLDRVVHVSTIGVSGNAEGVFHENDLDVGQSFNSPYEKSKFQAEQLVGQYRDRGLNIIIVRPSMIIGDSQTGYTNHFNIFYFQVRLLSQGVIDVMPVHEDSVYNLIPADSAAPAITTIASSAVTNMNFHIVNAEDMKVTRFVEYVCKYLGYKKPSLLSPTDCAADALSGVRGRLLGMLAPYIMKYKSFDSKNADRILQAAGFTWPRAEEGFFSVTLDYCIYSGYLRLGSEVSDATWTYNA